MEIIVCIKQVPEGGEARFDSVTRRLDRTRGANVVNPFDRRAIALAVDLTRRFGGTATALTLGPPQAREVLVEALASGIDRAVHLCDPAFAGSDTLATARALAAATRSLPCDLVLCGKYTVDGETGQVGPEIAELLGWPQITGARVVTLLTDAGTGPAAWRIEAERESDEGYEKVETTLPAVVTTAERLIQPIRPEPEALARAAQAPIEVLTAAGLGLPSHAVGQAGSPTTVLELREQRVARAPVTMQTGNVDEQAAALADLIRRWRRQYGAADHRRPLPTTSPGGDEAGAIWVVAERTVAGRPSGATLELLGEAAWLSRRLGGPAVAIVLDREFPALDALAAHGADRVVHLPAPAAPETRATALAALLEHRRRPHAVLFTASERGRELAPRVAARLGLGLTGDCIGLTLEQDGRLVQLKPALATAVVAPIWSRTAPQLATIRPGTFAAPAADWTRALALERAELAFVPPARCTTAREVVVEVDPSWQTLEGAAAVVGVGTGIGGPDSLPLIRRFAGLFGAAIGATRRVTDRGWLPRQVQIGLTGRIVAPELYVAVGIRGAPNHTVGVQGARTIVAINLASDAEIFRCADVGFTGDFRPLLERTCMLLKG